MRLFFVFFPPDACDVQKPEALADYRESAVRLAVSKYNINGNVWNNTVISGERTVRDTALLSINSGCEGEDYYWAIYCM